MVNLPVVKTVLIIVSGKVQGVYFRQSAKETARGLGIAGTVSNHQDGTVRVVVTGTAEKLEQFVAWCKLGPPRAVVAGVVVKEMELQVFQDFTIERK